MKKVTIMLTRLLVSKEKMSVVQILDEKDEDEDKKGNNDADDVG